MVHKIELQIRELRKEKQVTQRELAQKLHVSCQTISKWENGIALPDITFLPLLAEFFEVELEVLLGMKPCKPEVDLQNYAGEEYWSNQVERMKNWKFLYFNDDYLEFLVKKVWKPKNSMKILDCACGYGYLAGKLLPHMPPGSSYTGMDISEAFLEEGRRIFGENNRHVQFVQGNILEDALPKPNGTAEKYDMVISQLLLSYLPEPEAVIRKMKAALKPGGMLVLIENNLGLAEESFFIADGNAPLQANIPDPKKVWKYSAEQGELHYRLGTELAYFLRKNGLQHIDARMSDCVFTYDGCDSKAAREELEKYRDVLKHLERVDKEYAYYLNRGCSWQEAESFVRYQKEVFRLLDDPEVLISWAGCLYIVWGFLGER